MQRTLVIQTKTMIGKIVRICGWVNTKRDHGQVVFLDIRDRTGLLQVVCRLDNNEEIFNKVAQLKIESTIEVIGIIKERPSKMRNVKIETGGLELELQQITIFSISQELPFQISSDTSNIDEEKRLKYRYLDLRTSEMQKSIRIRHKVIKFIRDFMDKQDFIEIETPMLTKSTPEGARDFVVPSRFHRDKFYALPQSPQQYKQLLMVAGIERYFQIAKCLRDEDTRADRQPEFTQLDIEMAFVSQDDILNLIEELYLNLIKKIFPEKKITTIPFPRLKHEQAIKQYKSDDPDIRKNKSDPNELGFCWIIDFPLFTKQTKQDFFYGVGEKIAPSHHMFTSPKEEDIKMLDKEPLKVRAEQYDLILNGEEIGGGSIRIHDPKIQEKIFKLIGFRQKQKEQFSHLFSAFKYGVPPHGGIAFGIDRFLAIILNKINIREVIAFPKTGDGRCPMINAPCEITKEQKKELNIKINRKKISKKTKIYE